MTQVKYNAPWHPLKHVCVGKSYAPEFYEPVKNTQVRDSLQKIARETEEDYQNLIKVLKDFGIVVERPELSTGNNIMDFVDSNGEIAYKNSNSFTLIPRPPMQPRDSVLIVDDVILATNNEASWIKHLIDCGKIDGKKLVSMPPGKSFDAPLATVLGNTIVLDCRDHDWLYAFFCETFPNHKIVPVMIGGHNDAVYSVIKPGVIVSTYHHTTYDQTFPGWTVKYIENQSWNAIPDWRKFKHSNQGRWWVPDQEQNTEFGNFVNTWLTHWLGFVEETVFDVNMLQINEQCVLVNNYNQDLFEFFKQHQVEPIVVPFRHRFFWDGGLHCITNDIYRQGQRENYV